MHLKKASLDKCAGIQKEQEENSYSGKLKGTDSEKALLENNLSTAILWSHKRVLIIKVSSWQEVYS